MTSLHRYIEIASRHAQDHLDSSLCHALLLTQHVPSSFNGSLAFSSPKEGKCAAFISLRLPGKL
jgi:hypothetical protein